MCIRDRQEGESIGDVVRKHDVSVREIKQLNPGIDVFSIKKGDVIFVRCDEKKYKMKQGDTIISVAQMMGCDMIDLLRANEMCIRDSRYTADLRGYV